LCLAAGATVKVIINNGGDSYATRVTYATASSPYGMDISDIDDTTRIL
jgi:hypothetical protein